MAKDVLNKSKLSKEEDRILAKVLSCECHKPSKIYKILGWVDSHVSDRWKVALSMSIITFGLSILFIPLTNVLSGLCLFGFFIVGDYIYTYIVFSDYHIKAVMSIIRKIL